MELAVEFEDDLFFADLSKQISLLIMDDDKDDPLATWHSNSYQDCFGANNPTAQSSFIYEQSCKSKGTGVFIPQSTQPRRKQHRHGRYNNSSNTRSHYRQQQQHYNNLRLVSSQVSYNNNNSSNPTKG